MDGSDGGGGAASGGGFFSGDYFSSNAEGKGHYLPGCIIIGVRKCGTRALIDMLNLHPQVNKYAPIWHLAQFSFPLHDQSINDLCYNYTL